MADANQDLFDASLRHQIGVRRFAGGEVKDALRMLEQADKDLTRRLRQHLRRMEGQRTVTSRRYREMIKDVRALRLEIMTTFQQHVRQQMFDFAKVEAAFEHRMLTAATPFNFEYATARAEVLRAAVVSTPFAGGANAARTLNDWFTTLRQADARRLQDAITLGIVQEEPVERIVQRVVGTRANGYRDGVLAVTRRNGEAVVRTAINHVSNAARESVWKENKDVITALRWNATLDGRTSKVCMARDGHHTPVEFDGSLAGVPEPTLTPINARPPAHPNCRSVMIAVLSPNGLADKMGERPMVRDSRTRRQRERDFRAEARQNVGQEQWKRLDQSQRNALVRDQRRAWTQKNVGSVPADVTYDQWLRRQPTGFQNEVLGVNRAQAFRKGMPVDKFVDRRGMELNLDQLRRTNPEFFE